MKHVFLLLLFTQKAFGLDTKLLEAFEKIKTGPELDCSEDSRFHVPIKQNNKTPENYCEGMYFKVHSPELVVKHPYMDSTTIQLFRQNDISGTPTYSHSVEGKKYSEERLDLSGVHRSVFPTKSIVQDFPGRGKEHIIRIVDQPVIEEMKNGKVDHRALDFVSMRITQLTLFPRKFVPSVQVTNTKAILHLTTGERVEVDLKSGRIISGALSNKWDVGRVVKKGKGTLTYPDYKTKYTGNGIFIETKLTSGVDERLPGSIVSVSGYRDGELSSCEMKSEDIWVQSSGSSYPKGHPKYSEGKWKCTRFKFETDEDFYRMIKEKCPKFKFPKLISVD